MFLLLLILEDGGFAIVSIKKHTQVSDRGPCCHAWSASETASKRHHNFLASKQVLQARLFQPSVALRLRLLRAENSVVAQEQHRGPRTAMGPENSVSAQERCWTLRTVLGPKKSTGTPEQSWGQRTAPEPKNSSRAQEQHQNKRTVLEPENNSQAREQHQGLRTVPEPDNSTGPQNSIRCRE